MRLNVGLLLLQNPYAIKKMDIRIFFHFIDMICVNAWLLWRRAVNLDSHLPLAEFKLEIAEVFTKSNAEDLAVLYSHNWRWKKRNTLLLYFQLGKFQQTIKIICRNWETGNDVNILSMDQNHLYFAKNAKFISVWTKRETVFTHFIPSKHFSYFTRSVFLLCFLIIFLIIIKCLLLSISQFQPTEGLKAKDLNLNGLIICHQGQLQWWHRKGVWQMNL